MKLEFSGAPEVSAPRARVWAHLRDPNFVAASAPGVETVEALDSTHFKVVSGLGVGAVKVRFQLDVALSDIIENQHLRMSARGRAPGSAVETVSVVRLEDTPAGGTRLHWSATSAVNGKVASVGARLLEGTARRLTEEFWSDFARRIGNSA
jgi:carbon monoxide dehydrogenase subunit G